MIAHSTVAPLSSPTTISDSAPPSFLPGARTDSASAAFADYIPMALNGTTGAGNAAMAPRPQAAGPGARQADGAGANCPVFSPAARKAALRAMPGYIDGSKILRDTVEQWEEQGVSRRTIDAIRNGVPSRPRDEDAPAIFALGAALRASGAYDDLRTQAIKVYRSTCAWKETVARLQAEYPGYGRQQLENQLAGAMLRLDGDDHRHHATVLDRLLQPESIIDLDSADAAIDTGIGERDSGAADADTATVARHGHPAYI